MQHQFHTSSPATSFRLKGVTAFILSATLAACGGGNSVDSSLPVTLTGTAATGAAFPAGTAITVTDANGTIVGTSSITSVDGTFTVTVSAAAKAPLIIQASADGFEPLISVSASTNSGNINITPITHLIASQLSSSGDPSKLAEEIKAGTVKVDAAAVDTKVAEIKALLRPVTEVTGNSNDNPLTVSFKAGSAGYDQVLDAVKISVKPGQADGSTKVQIATTAAADSTAAGGLDNPITISKSVGTMTITDSKGSNLGDGKTLTQAVVPTVDIKTLPPAGAMAAVNDLLKRMETCYNLPKAQRATGSTASTLSDTCKSVFWASDASTYKQNSYTVGSANSGAASAWNTIFSNTDTTVLKWDQAQVMYVAKKTVDGKDVGLPVVQARWTATFPCTTNSSDTCQNTGIDRYVLRADTSGKLFQYGNQSDYDIAVDPRVEYRDLPNFVGASASSNYSYFNVGYNLYVKDTGTLGYAIVTTPRGNTLTLKPIPGGGYSYLGIAKGNGTATALCTNAAPINCVSTTSVIRMAAKYIDNTATSSSGSGTNASTNHPRDIDGALAWSANFDGNGTFTGWNNWEEKDIAVIPDQGEWTFDIYDKNGNKLATEKRRTTARIPTLAETQKIVWPKLTDAARTNWIEKTKTTGGFALSVATPIYVTADMSATGADAWTVPTGAWAPTSVKVYGSYKVMSNGKVSSTTSFDDEVSVRSSW